MHECIPSSSINLLHSQNSHHVHSQQHPECRVLLFALFLNSQLCELVGQGWMEEGSCSRHTWQLRESSEESDLVHRSSFDTVNCKFSSGEFPNVRDEVAPAFWQIKSCRITSSIWLFFFFVSILIVSPLLPQRFIQYLASRNTLFNLNNFLDKGALQGMSETWTPFLSLKHYTHTHTDYKPSRSFPQAMTCPRSSGGTADISMRKPFPIGWWLLTSPRWREGG